MERVSARRGLAKSIVLRHVAARALTIVRSIAYGPTLIAIGTVFEGLAIVRDDAPTKIHALKSCTSLNAE